jgi:hypothetical protein
MDISNWNLILKNINGKETEFEDRFDWNHKPHSRRQEECC